MRMISLYEMYENLMFGKLGNLLTMDLYLDMVEQATAE